jgi:hypothetical protein
MAISKAPFASSAKKYTPMATSLLSATLEKWRAH